MASHTGLLSQLRLSDQDRGPPQRRIAWHLWPVLLLAASGFAFGMWLRSATNAASASGIVTGSLTVSAATASETPKPGPAMTAAADSPEAAAVALEANGYVVARQEATVSSQIEGLVTEILVEEGDSVVAGQLLARLDADLLSANHRLAQSELEAVRARLPALLVKVAQAEAAGRRAESLLRAQLISDVEAERAQFALAAARADVAQLRQEVSVAEHRLALQTERLAHTEIRAPFAGVVIYKAAQPGEIISPYSGGAGSSRTGICTIVDMSSIEIEVDVSESNMRLVYRGQRVTATATSWPELAIPAEVITIVPTADRSRGTVRVRIGLLERDSRILPDMAVRVAFTNYQKGADRHD